MKLFENEEVEDEYDERKINYLRKISSLATLTELTKNDDKKKGVKFYLDAGNNKKILELLKTDEDEKANAKSGGMRTECKILYNVNL